MTKTIFHALLALCIISACSCSGQASSSCKASGTDSIAAEIAGRAGISDARITVAAVCGDDTVAVASDSLFPLMSVFKMHVAVAVLDKADRGLLNVDSIMQLTPDMLRPGTYSPMRDAAAGKPVSKSIRELLFYSVAKSDNIACDLLINAAGGIGAVDSTMRAKGIADVQLTETEQSMHDDLTRSYNNRSTPMSLCALMDDIFQGRILSAQSSALLTQLLADSTTGRDKIMAGVPQECFAGHKSGLSDRLPDGVLMASADAAALRMPDGRMLYLAILVKDSHESDEATSRIFSDIAAIVYRGLSH